MLPMFKPPKGEKRKALMTEINRDIKETFEKTFAENYQQARKQLIDGGVAEEKVDVKLNQIKARLEKKMIIEANRLLREEVLKAAREEMEESQKESNSASELNLTRIPKKNRTSS